MSTTAPAPDPLAGGTAAAATLTKWFIFEPDETMLVWTCVTPDGVLASNKKAAENKHYRGRKEPVRCCTVSENNWKPWTWKPRVVQPSTREPIQMGTQPGPFDQEAVVDVDVEPGPDFGTREDEQ